MRKGTALTAADQWQCLSTSYTPRRNISAQGCSSCPGCRSQRCTLRTKWGAWAAEHPSLVACGHMDPSRTLHQPPWLHQRVPVHSRDSGHRPPAGSDHSHRRCRAAQCLRCCCGDGDSGVPSSSGATKRTRAAWEGWEHTSKIVKAKSMWTHWAHVLKKQKTNRKSWLHSLAA